MYWRGRVFILSANRLCMIVITCLPEIKLINHFDVRHKRKSSTKKAPLIYYKQHNLIKWAGAHTRSWTREKTSFACLRCLTSVSMETRPSLISRYFGPEYYTQSHACGMCMKCHGFDDVANLLKIFCMCVRCTQSFYSLTVILVPHP